MPRRRPPRDGLVVNNILRFAAAVILLPWLADAQQPQPPVLQRHKSHHEGREPQRLEVTKIARNLETPFAAGRRKNTLSANNDKNVKNDASAIATLAPVDESAVAAPPTRRSGNTGLGSPQIARNLEDWEVEDFVLLATVDGQLHARDRKTGKERWNLVYEKPMVETTEFLPDRSSVEEDYEPLTLEGYKWIVEPSRDGSLFVFKTQGPDRGLVNTGLTMKSLVEELSPYGGEDPYVTYTGAKKTSMVTIDAKTGAVVKFFGTGGNLVNPGKCVNSNAFLDKGECSPNATLTIGRTEYTVTIQERKYGDQIASLTFSEWSPNNFDRDLQSQYDNTLDGKYVVARHDGSVIGIEHQEGQETRRLWKHKFSTPVARIFDVARPWGTEKEDPELTVLPQPIPPNQDDGRLIDHPSSNIFLNQTEDGSWYAMSGKSYPFAVQGQRAQYSDHSWLQKHPSWDVIDEFDLNKALVGLHSIKRKQEKFMTISGPKDEANGSNGSSNDTQLLIPEPPTFVERLQELPMKAAIQFKDFVQNPMWLLVFLLFVISNQRQIRTYIGRFGDTKVVEKKVKFEAPSKDVPEDKDKLPDTPKEELASIPTVEVAAEPESSRSDDSNDESKEAVPRDLTPKNANPSPIVGEAGEEKIVPEKKKAHRGRRGGVKHKKGPRKDSDPSSQDGNPPKPQPTIEQAVKDAQNLGQKTALEPDIKTMPSNPAEVSGPIIRIGALEVNTEKLIGTGSNGTMVFEGNFDGRAVAVKRMLIQFFDIASQETKLLRESDDHPNVIRYYAQQQAAGFLYIALELCPASLADVIDKPHLHRELAQGGEKDLPNVLYQITNGLRHLHSLRIVHRDLKPQNILVAMGKGGRPRLLVSDFGLCKKLEGEQSSFRATTAHAAGTSGWRAPELLLDDDAKEGSSMIDASTDGNSGPLINAEFMPNRRATRAIDIFSLGLVFFYVLTKGSHPFDCGDRYMREVNIRKNTFNLAPLEVLGDYAFEATDLIASMLEADPKRRPSAHNVLAHPFFWSPKKRLNFLCDVSDHFEKEKRDPPSPALQELENWAPSVCRGDFLKPLGREFVESMGKQRKYTGTRLLDLLRALRNKKNHYEDMSDHLKEHVGPLPDGYLSFWTRKFPNLLIACWNIVYDVQWDDNDRFREYYQPAVL